MLKKEIKLWEILLRISLGTPRYVPSGLVSRFRALIVPSHATNESLRPPAATQIRQFNSNYTKRFVF